MSSSSRMSISSLVNEFNELDFNVSINSSQTSFQSSTTDHPMVIAQPRPILASSMITSITIPSSAPKPHKKVQFTLPSDSKPKTFLTGTKPLSYIRIKAENLAHDRLLRKLTMLTIADPGMDMQARLERSMVEIALDRLRVAEPARRAVVAKEVVRNLAGIFGDKVNFEGMGEL